MPTTKPELWRLCAEPYCPEVIPKPQRYCSTHAAGRGWEQWRRTPNGMARQRGYSTRWRKLRDERMRAARGLCEYCRRAPATEVHHVGHELPTDPGFYDLERLRATCNPCHRKRSHERERGVGRRTPLGRDL